MPSDARQQLDDCVSLLSLQASFEMACAGHGVTTDHRLSYALLEAAAAQGDPTAQGMRGFQQSVGLQPSTSGSHRSFSFGATNAPQALLNYFFAASGNDSFSQMVLGYRHAHGLGVPKSCEAAVLYYHPVAEKTIALASIPNSLPLVRHKAFSPARPVLLREQSASALSLSTGCMELELLLSAQKS